MRLSERIKNQLDMCEKDIRESIEQFKSCDNIVIRLIIAEAMKDQCDRYVELSRKFKESVLLESAADVDRVLKECVETIDIVLK